MARQYLGEACRRESDKHAAENHTSTPYYKHAFCYESRPATNRVITISPPSYPEPQIAKSTHARSPGFIHDLRGS